MGRVTGAAGLSGEIWEALGRAAAVVTGNERAARTLRRGWDELRRSEGAVRWEPARALSWAAWTGGLWRRMVIEGRARSLLLNGLQEHVVWRGVLGDDEEARGLRGVDGLASMAAESWARIWAYTGAAGRRVAKGRVLAMLQRDAQGSRDTGAFARWAKVFEERCAAGRWVTAAELNAVLAEAVRSGGVLVEAKEMLLVGFDRLTPSQETLVAALRGVGVSVARAKAGGKPGRAVLVAAEDEGEELRACARWAAALLKRDDGRRVAVIVPDLARDRAATERVFREAMAPELEAITAGEAEPPYAFSLGRMMAEMPMVAVAMTLLRWAAGALPLERVSGLLVSEYFAGASEERYPRAEFDELELRRGAMLQPEVGLGAMVRRVSGWRCTERVPELRAAVRRMERRAASYAGASRSYGVWAEEFRAYLKDAGWGAPGSESSEEYQVRERWESALDALATLDFLDSADGTVSFAEALGVLERVAGETVFAPERSSAAVQVMGPLEAAGSAFDAVWLLRGGETSWPPGVRALPLLSWGVQRELGMPGADAERDLRWAKELTERIVRSGREVVVSYARAVGEVTQRAAGVVRGLGLEEMGVDAVAGAEPVRSVVAMEMVEEAGGVPLAGASAKGGVRVLELQAACGFRAFAEQRLGSRELEERELGLHAREGGSAVHLALERFWAEVESQAALQAMSSEARGEALGRAIEEALRRAAAAGVGRWDAAYLDVQRARLRRLLDRWMDEELKRPAFEVMRREEAMEDVELGPLRFRLRVDRVDLVDGRQVVIDYKTGSAGPTDWLGERPDRPQVPLYAVLAARTGGVAGAAEAESGEEGPPPLGAVAYGVVRAGKEAKMRGFAAEPGLLPPGRPSRMDEASFGKQVERWRGVLERLAGEFAAGDARVRPKNYPGTCAFCGQRGLCRLDASMLEEIEEAGEDADG